MGAFLFLLQHAPMRGFFMIADHSTDSLSSSPIIFWFRSGRGGAKTLPLLASAGSGFPFSHCSAGRGCVLFPLFRSCSFIFFTSFFQGAEDRVLVRLTAGTFLMFLFFFLFFPPFFPLRQATLCLRLFPPSMAYQDRAVCEHRDRCTLFCNRCR